MAKKTINRGTSPNDNTGDHLRGGAEKINDNFTELYNLLEALNLSVGTINDTLSSISTAVSTLSGNLHEVAFSGSYNDLADKPTIPTVKRQEVYSGSTNGSGLYTVTFAAFSVAPDVRVEIVNPTVNQYVRVTSISTTGFTVHVFQRNSINLLGSDILLSTTVNVNAASVNVMVTEK